MPIREKNKVSYLHFILSVLVILIHSINNESKVERLFSAEFGIGQFAVPLFFVISGFLFMRNVGNTYDVKRKLRKRVYTLLIPFLLWNVIYYGIHLFFNPGVGVSIAELVDAAFNYKYNPSFWFIYQLILLTILSLLFEIVIRKESTIALFYIVCILLIILDIDIPYVNEDAIIYYFTGAVFAKYYNKRKVLFISKKDFIYALIISVLVFVLNRFARQLVTINFSFRTVFILSVILVRLAVSFMIFYLCDLLFSYNKVYKFMQETFFLYAIHYAIVKAMIILMKFIMYKYLPGDFFYPIELFVFFASPIVCIIVNYYLSNFMKKHFSKEYKVLVGNR